VAAIDRAFEPVRVPFATGLALWRRRHRDTRKCSPYGTEPTETLLTLATARDVRRGDRWLPWHGEGSSGIDFRVNDPDAF
jgi:hypothetical protein